MRQLYPANALHMYACCVRTHLLQNRTGPPSHLHLGHRYSQQPHGLT